MKRIIHLLLVLALVIIMVSCTPEPEPEPWKDSFEIYITSTEGIRDFGYYDVENLSASGAPVITGDDIRNYYWDQHLIELNGSFLEKLAAADTSGYNEYDDTVGYRQYTTGGSKFLGTGQYMGFMVVVDGAKVYSGTFPVGTASPQEQQTLILVDFSDDKIALVFNGDGFDIRNNDLVYDYFNKKGKLAQMTGDDSSEIVNELQERLESSEERYSELKKAYDELAAGAVVPEGPDPKAATIDWLERRLELYMRETQESGAYKVFGDRLLALDLSDVESIGEGADIFRQTAVANTEANDRMFNIFEEFYYTVIDAIPVYNSIADINGDFIRSAAENLVTITTENGVISAFPTVGGLSGTFGIFLSPQLNEYLLILDIERGILTSAGTSEAVEGGALVISHNATGELAYLWKRFTIDYPYTYPFNFKAADLSEYYMDIYIGKTGFTESPIYEGENLAVRESVKESYEEFIAEYTDSPYHPLVSDFYKVLSDNSFMFTQEVDEFINGVDYRNYK
jgi:hypothetical protein